MIWSALGVFSTLAAVIVAIWLALRAERQAEKANEARREVALEALAMQVTTVPTARHGGTCLDVIFPRGYYPRGVKGLSYTEDLSGSMGFSPWEREHTEPDIYYLRFPEYAEFPRWAVRWEDTSDQVWVTLDGRRTVRALKGEDLSKTAERLDEWLRRSEP